LRLGRFLGGRRRWFFRGLWLLDRHVDRAAHVRVDIVPVERRHQEQRQRCRNMQPGGKGSRDRRHVAGTFVEGADGVDHGIVLSAHAHGR
jgi:hypothetical protein